MPEALTIMTEDTVTFRRHPGKPSRLRLVRRPANNASPPYKFAYARTALKYGLKALGIGQGDSLLVPDLICESAIEPLAGLGVEPLYYPVDNALQPQWRAMERLLTDGTKALLIVHYFGQPQSIPDCVDFCRRHGVLLIEDNAHGYGATFDGRMLGTIGAAGVSAPRKSFAVPSGAYLHLEGNRCIDLPVLPLRPAGPSSMKRTVNGWLGTVPLFDAVLQRRKRIAEQHRRLGPPPDYDSQAAFRDPSLAGDYAMDESVHEYLAKQDLDAVRARRQQIYRIWEAWAVGQGLRPVFAGLSQGAMPLVFPAFTDGPEQSRTWFERGHRVGVDIHSWPTLPETVVAEDGTAMRLWERMICCPIHQEMDTERMSSVAKKL